VGSTPTSSATYIEDTMKDDITVQQAEEDLMHDIYYTNPPRKKFSIFRFLGNILSFIYRIIFTFFAVFLLLLFILG